MFAYTREEFGVELRLGICGEGREVKKSKLKKTETLIIVLCTYYLLVVAIKFESNFVSLVSYCKSN